MKRLTLALLSWAVLAVVVWPFSSGIRAAPRLPPGVCDELTPARMLEDPTLAHEWAQALRSSEPGEMARMKALLERIRAAHGCAGVAMPDPRLPPGHPPIEGGAPPELPPGHPPVPSAPWAPTFAEPGIVTI